MRSFPPQPYFHSQECAKRLGLAGEVMRIIPALDQWPHGRPHTCIVRRHPPVTLVVVPDDSPEHEYEPGKIYPTFAARPLCAYCRSTHDG